MILSKNNFLNGKIGCFNRRKIKSEGGEKTSSTLRKIFREKYSVEVGLYSYGSCFEPKFNIGGKVKIGRYCSFGMDVHYFGANHPIDHAVMSAYFYNNAFSGLDVNDVKRHELHIGHDVWIGHGSSIVSFCHFIGNGAAIGAGSVVTKDIPPYAIVAGVPAKIIRYRFDEETISKLEESRWWNNTPEELMKYYDDIDKPKIWAERIIFEQ